MARIAIYSDLHLEFAPWTPPVLDVDAVILAGDIYTKNRCLPPYIHDTKAVFGAPVVIVLGNHEHYGGRVDRTAEKMRPRAGEMGVTILENEQARIGGIRILGCTLWTDFRLFAGDDPVRLRLDAAYCADRLNDFRSIRIEAENFRKFRPKDAARQFRASVEWLRRKLLEPFDGSTIVVTHHAPSPRSLDATFASDPMAAAYASDLDDFILEFQPSLWVHGHIHTSCDYRIGRTRVVCNPRGYVPDQPNPEFREQFVVEI